MKKRGHSLLALGSFLTLQTVRRPGKEFRSGKVALPQDPHQMCVCPHQGSVLCSTWCLLLAAESSWSILHANNLLTLHYCFVDHSSLGKPSKMDTLQRAALLFKPLQSRQRSHAGAAG